MNSIYHNLSGVKFLAKKYTLKFLFIAFLGIHIPLIGLIIFILAKPDFITPSGVFLITLVLTLAATGVTLYILKGLLSPLTLSRQALQEYLADRKIPALPIHYTDEAGVLMSKVQETVTSLDILLEEKKDLIALLSHDLRAPLASIKLLCEAIAHDDDITLEECRLYSKQISDSVREQLGLFQRILEILRNDDIDRFHLNLEPITLTDVVSRAVKEIQPLAEKKRIIIKVDKILSTRVAADPDLIAQVVKNLLSNAVKFSHPDSVVNIRLSRDESQVSLSVVDNGVGFHPTEQEKLFQRFTSAGRLGTENETSTGMGLYLSSKIVKAHQGSLSASSAGPDQGSTFELKLRQVA